MSAPRNPSSAMALVLVDELIRCGVTEIVLAPGSRSAALAFAAHANAVKGRVRLHVRVDERSAGFLALGLAKVSHRPVPVVTTSGTAVANLHPAVLEASHAGVPLVVLSADRPARLRGTNANQTTDQVRMFGDAARLSVDVTPAYSGANEKQQVAGWRALACRAVAVARGRVGGARPGPVQLNLQFEEPLVPDADTGWTCAAQGRPGGTPWMQPGDPDLPQPEPLGFGPRTVVVAGDDAGPPARILAEAAGWPILAEPTSGARTGDHAIRSYRLLLDDDSLAGRIERVVVYGHPTLSRPVSRLLARDDVEIIAVHGRSGWTDAGHRVHQVVGAVQLDGARPRWAADRPAAGSAPARDDLDWLGLWRDRDAVASAQLDELLDKQDELSPHHVARAVSAALPPGGLLYVGASNPIRDLDLMAARHGVGERRLTIANRGLAGIDGTVSSAIGAALGRADTSRAFALMGDVTFLHDSNGLVIGPGEARPDLTIVVVNDDGGSLFGSLEQGAAAYADSFDKLFGTPHGVDIGALCAASGTSHRVVRSVESLDEALASPREGIEVVEAVVRRDNRRDLDAAIRALVSG